ncbi:MAG: hypothetical protein M3T56_07165 [Chloroflexota bacterium]|nr:hypothetical protein [Chloroflexota bacterium]
MHFVFPLVVWGLSFGAAYSVGRSWVEAKHANGLPWLGAWLLAALTSVGFTTAYFLLIVAVLESSLFEGVTPDMTAGLWDAWIAWVVAPVLALGGVSFLGGGARTYRDMVSASSVYFPTYAALNEKYGSVTSTPQAARAVTRDLTRRTRKKLFGGNYTDAYISDPVPLVGSGQGFTLPDIKLPKIELGSLDCGGDDGGVGGLVLVIAIVAAIIAVCLGVITTWVVISRIAGQSEPLPHPAPARA